MSPAESKRPSFPPSTRRAPVHYSDIGYSHIRLIAACWVTITVSNYLSLPYGDPLPSAGRITRIFNSSALQMVLFTYRKRRSAKNQGEEQAKKAHSDEIDLYIEEEAKSLRRLCRVLLISLCPYILTWGTIRPPLIWTGHSDCVGLLGIPESEPTAFALVKQMKLAHGAYAHEEFAEFRPLIWKNLLLNSRSVVMDIGSWNKVRWMFYTPPIR
jgi:hypothetical protein